MRRAMLTRSLVLALKVHVPALALKLGDCGTKTLAYPGVPMFPLEASYKLEEALKISIPSGSINQRNFMS